MELYYTFFEKSIFNYILNIFFGNIIIKGGEYEMNFDKKKIFIVDFVYFFLWLMIIYFVFKVAAVYLFPFLIGIIIAYIVQRPASIISKKIKINKKICAAVLSVFFFVAFFLFLLLIGWIVYSQSHRVIKTFINEGYSGKLIDNIFLPILEKINKFNPNQVITLNKIYTETLNEFIQKTGALLSNFFTSFIKKIPAFLFSFVITIVSTCYISKDFERLYLFLKGFISEKTLKKITDIKDAFLESFRGISIGYLWLFLITFIELIIGFLFLNISNVFLVAFLISIIDILPVFGTGIVLLPWSILEIFQYNYRKGIGLVVLYFIIVVVRNFVEPKIIGKQIGINPLFTMFFIFLGLKIGGVIGMITLPVLFTVSFNYLKKQIN